MLDVHAPIPCSNPAHKEERHQRTEPWLHPCTGEDMTAHFTPNLFVVMSQGHCRSYRKTPLWKCGTSQPAQAPVRRLTSACGHSLQPHCLPGHHWLMPISILSLGGSKIFLLVLSSKSRNTIWIQAIHIWILIKEFPFANFTMCCSGSPHFTLTKVKLSHALTGNQEPPHLYGCRAEPSHL